MVAVMQSWSKCARRTAEFYKDFKFIICFFVASCLLIALKLLSWLKLGITL